MGKAKSRDRDRDHEDDGHRQKKKTPVSPHSSKPYSREDRMRDNLELKQSHDLYRQVQQKLLAQQKQQEALKNIPMPPTGHPRIGDPPNPLLATTHGLTPTTSSQAKSTSATATAAATATANSAKTTSTVSQSGGGPVMSTNAQQTPQVTAPVITLTAEERAEILAEAKAEAEAKAMAKARAEAKAAYKQDLVKQMLAQVDKPTDKKKSKPAKAPAKDHDMSESADSDDDETTPNHAGGGGDKTPENVSEQEEISVDSDDGQDEQNGGHFVPEEDDQPEPPLKIGSNLIANFNKMHESLEDPTSLPVNEDLLKNFNIAFKQKIKSDVLNKQLDNIPRPENLECLLPIRTDKAIWKGLEDKDQKSDIKFQRAHTAVHKAASAMANVLRDLQTSMDNDDTSMLDPEYLVNQLMYGIVALGYTSQQLVYRRREWMKDRVAPDVREICSESQPWNNELFGGDLAQQSKEIMDTNRLTVKLSKKEQDKKKFAHRGRGGANYRGRGANSWSRGNSGGRRPFLGRGRGYNYNPNWQNRQPQNPKPQSRGKPQNKSAKK